jgi:RNA polymerase sigma-70 factor (ECF subfamily)
MRTIRNPHNTRFHKSLANGKIRAIHWEETEGVLQPYQRDMTLPSDADLLKQIQVGDEAAFRTLVDRHGRYLFGIAHSLLGNAADAEDVVQETLMAALNANFRGESSVKTWLVAILVNQSKMLRRKKRPQALIEDVPKESAAASSDAKMDLSMMLRELSPEHRQIIVLRELERMSYQEIAAALGVPQGTVESRLHRAREELRKRFAGYLT